MVTLIVWMVLIGGMLALAARITAPLSVWTALTGAGLVIAFLLNALTGTAALLLVVAFIALWPYY